MYFMTLIEIIFYRILKNVLRKIENLRGKSDGGGSRCILVDVLDSNIVVSKFDIQSRYYIRFRTKYLGKYSNHLSHIFEFDFGLNILLQGSDIQYPKNIDTQLDKETLLR